MLTSAPTPYPEGGGAFRPCDFKLPFLHLTIYYQTKELVLPKFKADEENMIIIENGSRYFQIYKINETQQLAGYFYERLINGTTKKIGTFILNRVDQF